MPAKFIRIDSRWFRLGRLGGCGGSGGLILVLVSRTSGTGRTRRLGLANGVIELAVLGMLTIDIINLVKVVFGGGQIAILDRIKRPSVEAVDQTSVDLMFDLFVIISRIRKSTDL